VALYQLSYSPRFSGDSSSRRPSHPLRRVVSVEGTPSDVGARAEQAVAFALPRAGRSVYLPRLAPHGRVDLVVDAEGRLLRVQCKTSRLRGGVVSFRTCSNTGNIRKGYDGEVDLFGVYSPEVDADFPVPVDHVATRVCHRRVSPSRDGQRRGVRWANDYRVVASATT
jgi:hypothetical protein